MFFDRGVIEGIAIVQETTPLPPGDLQNLLSAYTFHRTVFALPPWEAIFTTDAERDQSFTESVTCPQDWYGGTVRVATFFTKSPAFRRRSEPHTCSGSD